MLHMLNLSICRKCVQPSIFALIVVDERFKQSKLHYKIGMKIQSVFHTYAFVQGSFAVSLWIRRGPHNEGFSLDLSYNGLNHTARENMRDVANVDLGCIAVEGSRFCVQAEKITVLSPHGNIDSCRGKFYPLMSKGGHAWPREKKKEFVSLLPNSQRSAFV